MELIKVEGAILLAVSFAESLKMSTNNANNYYNYMYGVCRL